MEKRRLQPVHPGEVLYEDFIAPAGITVHRLALNLRVPANRIHEIVRGDRSISADTALRLARYLGTTAQFWLNLQASYDLKIAEAEFGARIEREVQPRTE
jgi:addiction module HigA family antidote